MKRKGPAGRDQIAYIKQIPKFLQGIMGVIDAPKAHHSVDDVADDSGDEAPTIVIEDSDLAAVELYDYQRSIEPTPKRLKTENIEQISKKNKWKKEGEPEPDSSVGDHKHTFKKPAQTKKNITTFQTGIASDKKELKVDSNDKGNSDKNRDEKKNEKEISKKKW